MLSWGNFLQVVFWWESSHQCKSVVGSSYPTESPWMLVMEEKIYQTVLGSWSKSAARSLTGFRFRGVFVPDQIVFFSRPSPKAGRELQTELDRIMDDGWGGGPLAKNQPEPVTGPWVYTETVYLLLFITVFYGADIHYSTVYSADIHYPRVLSADMQYTTVLSADICWPTVQW